MRITINRNSKTPIYVQIKKQIKDMIITKILPEGFSLPAERKLAEQLGVNRSTVIKAYQELKADGLVDSYVGKGTVVLPMVYQSHEYNTEPVNPIPWNQFFNENVFLANNHIISDIIEAASKEKTISFAGGISSRDLYPVKAMREIQIELFQEKGTLMFSHSSVEGYYPLRESISELLEKRQITVLPKEVIILSGSQQGLDFISRIFIKPGDTVIVEEPTYLGAIQLFRSLGAKIIGIPIDKYGMRIDYLKSTLDRFKPKFIYTLPTFQNPSGVSMSLERRYELLDLAYSYQIPIVEDDPYGEIVYGDNFLPPIKALDKNNYVIYISTFSKVLFMGLRVGWIAASEDVIKKLSYIKQITDLHVNTPAQMLLDRFLRKGYYENHLQMIRREYSKKRDLMLECLEKYKVSGVEWDKPNGGYYIWCRLPEGVSHSKLFINASREGVIYLPGEAFYPDGTKGESYMRLNYTFPNSEEIEEGIKRLMRAVEKTLREANDTLDRYIEFSKTPIV